MIDFNTATNEEIKSYFANNFKQKSNTIDLFKEIAPLRGGECLSTLYLNNKSHLSFKCQEGHIFSSQPITIKRGAWCLQCSNKKTNINRSKNNEESFLERIEKLNLKLIGNLNSTKKESTFECRKGHQFNVLGRYLYRDDYICPICINNTGRYKSEHIIRLYLETAFNQKFIKCNPNWLKMEDSGRNLELDGYCEELNLAYEYQGEQHNSPTAFYQNRLEQFERRLELDKRKKLLCQKKGVILIEISEIPKQDNSFNNIYSHLINTFKKYNMNFPTIEEKDINLKNVYQEDYYNDLVKIAQNKGGSVESTVYLGSSTKMTFKCKDGHLFDSQANKVKLGSWCPYCTGQKGNTLDKIKELAIQNGGQCLSEKYIDNQYKYEFSCKNSNHPNFFSTKGTILKGSWCPYCANNFDFRLSQYNDLVKVKKGILVQSRVSDETKPLQWQCVHKHQFKLTIEEIKNDKWCKKCDN